MNIKVIKTETTYCSQCKMQEKELLLLHPFFKDYNIELVHVNVDDNEEFAVQHHIEKVPTILVVGDGEKEYIRFAGFTKSDEIKKHLQFFFQDNHE